MNELLKRIENLERENGELKAWKKSFDNASSILGPFQQSLLGRIPTLITSTKTVASETISVLDVDGATPVSVLDIPDGWVEVKNVQLFADGKRFFVPVWKANYNDPAI